MSGLSNWRWISVSISESQDGQKTQKKTESGSCGYTGCYSSHVYTGWALRQLTSIHVCMFGAVIAVLLYV